MASFRYRCLIPGSEIGKINGYKCSINTGAADIMVLSKPLPQDVDLAKKAMNDCRVIADFCDDHFDHKTLGEPSKQLARMAHTVICPTPVMADVIFNKTGRVVSAVIPDPYEEELRSPHASAARKFLWFGHPRNLADLIPWQPFIKNLDLRICTGPNKGVGDYVPWSPQTQKAELDAAHIVLLPTRKGAEYKSPNRLINAIRAGCFAVCGDHPAYKEFRKFVWVGNFATGIKWAIHFREDLDGLVSEAQAYVEKYSPANVGKLWAEVLK